MSDLKEQFVTYEIALKLKELGFNEECLGYYHINEGYSKGYAFCYSESTGTNNCSILSPLWQQVIDWFDEKDLHIIVSFPQSVSGCIGYISSTENNMILIADAGTIWENRYSFYEQAVLKAIETVKNEL